MKLSSARVTDFRSIRDSNVFEIADVTCLVGKNESGKTALLQALYRLNPVVEEDGVYDITDDYPRADVEDYRQTLENSKADPAIVIRATFTLEDAEIKTIEAEFGTSVLTSGQFTLSKKYDNKRIVDLPVNEKIAGVTLLKAAGLYEEFGAQKWHDLQSLSELLAKSAAERSEQFNQAKAKLTDIADPDEKAKATAAAQLLAESNASKQMRTKVAAILKRGLALHIWDNTIKPTLPVFLYFDEYYQMEGHVNIEQLKARQANKQLLDSDRPMLGLIELARLNLDELVSPKRTEALISKLEGASNHLSKQVLKYWSQNRHLTVRFDVRPGRPGDPRGMETGTNLLGRVYDSVHLVSTPLGTRSRGFVWFFSFLAWFSQQKKRNQPLILLLDEPGLVLHGTAQNDLLRYIEDELQPFHQVIYTTHSPFMVDATRFDRVRIVEDKSMDAEEELPPESRGTKVETDVLSVEQGSLFPLQGALGYQIAQTLFIGSNCLVVEGPSDLLYLQLLTSVLQKQGKTGLKEQWTITPVGGADKVPTFVALLGAQKGLNIATLIDVQHKDRQKIENLYKSKLLKKKNVFTFAEFAGKPEADIEDMFDPEFYLKIVNGEYHKSLRKPLTETDLKLEGRRITVAIEEYFLKESLPKGEHFNHYRPARFLIENSKELVPDLSGATVLRFESLFRALNDLL